MYSHFVLAAVFVCKLACAVHPARHISTVKIKVRNSLLFMEASPLFLKDDLQAARIKQVLDLVAVAHKSLEFT